MALHWNITDTKFEPRWVKAVATEMGGHRYPTPEDPPEKIEEFMHPVISAVIWGMLGIEMREITEANWEKVYRRFRALEIADGHPYLLEPSKITPDLIKSLIGLKTNVSPASDASFKTKLFRRINETLDKELK